MTTVADEAQGAPGRPALKSRYVLLTQCLQNDFFLNRECRIYLGDQSSKAMLIGPTRPWSVPGTTGQVQVAASELRTGPLACFFEASIGRRRRREDGLSTLHVINIRDWHEPGVSYDLERRSYGSHCERGTWGAGYIDGLQKYLDPACRLRRHRGVVSRRGQCPYLPRPLGFGIRLPPPTWRRRYRGGEVTGDRAREHS